MSEYYFLTAALPPLQGNSSPISFKEFFDLCKLNLSAKDLREVERLLRGIDLYNVRALWLGEPLDERGNFKAKELEEKLITQEDLPDYFVDFLDRYETVEERLRNFSFLSVSFYDRESAKPGRFLQKYNRFERETRLVLSAARAKKSGRDIVSELQFEDPSDLLIADILSQKDAPDYLPPAEYEDLVKLFSDHCHDPWDLQMAILQYKLSKIEEMEEVQDFGIDRVLAYAARLLLIEEVTRLSRAKGMEQLTKYE